MTIPNQAQENQTPPEAPKANDKDYNFAQMRKALEQERAMNQQNQQRLAQLEQERVDSARKPYKDDDDEESDEPYVDRKKLKKEISRAGEQIKADTKQEVQQAVRSAIDEERRSNYLRENNDFNEVMNADTVQKFADKYPKLAENILRMPDGFERQKLVYENIKALGVNKKEEPKQNIQQTVDQNRRGPSYHPSGVGTAPYAAAGDYSPSGQKSAYQKMQELKNKLRI